MVHELVARTLHAACPHDDHCPGGGCSGHWADKSQRSDAVVCAGVIELPILGRPKHCKYMVMFEGLPLNSALFESVIY